MNQDDKDIVKEAIKEWMTEQKAAFGWWVLKAIGIAALTMLLTWWVSTQGLRIPHG